jgi:hypothetical protein
MATYCRAPQDLRGAVKARKRIVANVGQVPVQIEDGFARQSELVSAICLDRDPCRILPIIPIRARNFLVFLS